MAYPTASRHQNNFRVYWKHRIGVACLSTSDIFWYCGIFPSSAKVWCHICTDTVEFVPSKTISAHGEGRCVTVFLLMSHLLLQVVFALTLWNLELLCRSIFALKNLCHIYLAIYLILTIHYCIVKINHKSGSIINVWAILYARMVNG